MFKQNSKTYKLVPGIQIIEDEFTAGYIVEELDYGGNIISQYFTNLTKPKITDRIKDQNGFKTSTEQVIDKMLEVIE